MRQIIVAVSLLALLVTTGRAQDAGTGTRLTGVAGFVINQDYEPIAKAKVTLRSMTFDIRQGTDEGMITTETDEHGHYFFKVDTLRESSWVNVSAEGYPDYTGYYTHSLKEGSQAETIMMVNKAYYHKGQYATIVLPNKPEADLGRFFRLDRVEDDKVIFERELQPQADTPYVIIPDRDFEIAYDASLPQFAGKTDLGEVWFQGYYQYRIFGRRDSEYHVVLDATPDCDYRGDQFSLGTHVVMTNRSRIGANRAVLVMHDSSGNNWRWGRLTSPFSWDTWRDKWFLCGGLLLHDSLTGETMTWQQDVAQTAAPAHSGVTGFVLDQDKNPIANATVLLTGGGADISATTDDYGHFLLPVNDAGADYEVSVAADGHRQQQFQDVWQPFNFSQGALSCVLSLHNAVNYKKGQRATIILPAKPDETLGRYYKLTKVENGKVIFDRELHPQASVPYVIIPEQDFTISCSLNYLPATRVSGATASGARLFGTFVKTPYHRKENEFTILIDQTDDCQYVYAERHSIGDAGCTIGAMRAVLILDSSQYDWAAYDVTSHHPQYSYFLENNMVFNEETVDAQQYRPMLKDGKRWCYYYTNNFHEGSFLYMLSGDTLIDGNKGYRLYATWIDQWTGDTISHGLAGAMYENGGRTYYISHQNRKMQICNMNLNVGDSIPFGKGVVTGTDYIYAMGNKLKRLTISRTFDPLLPPSTVYWVEGVGSSIEAESDMPLVTCYEDSRCIFTAKNFEGMPAEKTDVESGRSLLSEGRTWWYQDDSNYWYGYPKEYRVFIQGDTLIDGKRWHKVYSDHVIGTETVYLKALREDNGKVYELRQDGEEKLLFDFTMGVGDCYVPTGSDDRYMEVIAVDTMLSAGKPHRRLILQQHVNGVDTDLTCWIEGIGSDCGIDVPAFWSDRDAKYINSHNGTDYYSAIFLGCSELDGKCLYGDLSNIATDIPAIHHPSSSTSLHDLQGRRLTAPPAKGIYVKDGQKVIVK